MSYNVFIMVSPANNWCPFCWLAEHVCKINHLFTKKIKCALPEVQWKISIVMCAMALSHNSNLVTHNLVYLWHLSKIPLKNTLPAFNSTTQITTSRKLKSFLTIKRYPSRNVTRDVLVASGTLRYTSYIYISICIYIYIHPMLLYQRATNSYRLLG